MRELLKNDVETPYSHPFTTGEVGQICGLSQQTIIRAFEAGLLKGHRIPGSRFRQIPPDSLRKFLKDEDLEGLVPDAFRILLFSRADIRERVQALLNRLEEKTEVIMTDDTFDLALTLQETAPRALLIDTSTLHGDLVVKNIKPHLDEEKGTIMHPHAIATEVYELPHAQAVLERLLKLLRSILRPEESSRKIA